ncbi:glycoside hydrolase family 172 protein [Actinopolyspora mortivallis]|uniref:glycoside hydrolase family 172 protein n=1 Tax=Actinopolyspora mortivallis TaxID=33906 RepID=UPI0003608451|nr:glycoside hydrolase family 172 protein [Actinopolyspora mortivallis]
MVTGSTVTARSRSHLRNRTTTALALVVATVAATAAAVGPPPRSARAATHSDTATSVGKGPVGWQTYRRLDRLGEPRPAQHSAQFSSFSRSGSNDDGFEGTYSCLRTTERGCVIAEHTGPGEITSLWFTRQPWGDVSATGDIRIDLDGRTVLEAPLSDVVSGELGAPFVWPLVGDARDTAGGAVIKVPMPYRESMRVTVEHNPRFYHVGYRSFADAHGVRTFDPSDPARDVIRRLRRFGVADPKPAAAEQERRQRTFALRPGESVRLSPLRGPASIDELRLRIPQVTAAPRVIDDGRAFGSGGGSSFTARISPDNEGVRITRRYDAGVGEQVAELLVDGTPVGTWRSGAARPGEWGRQSIEVDQTLTAGRERLRISNRFRSAAVDVNEFRYEVHSRVDGRWTRTDVLDLGPAHPGEERAHDYRVDNEVFTRDRLLARFPVDEREVTASDEILANTRLRVSFDGRTTVDAPIGEFFGTGLGEYDVRRLMSSVDAGRGWYVSWWPMPFRTEAEIELVNNGSVPIRTATLEATTSAREAAGTAREGYFHATHRAGHTQPGSDWTFLDVEGSGTFHGVTHTMRGRIPPGTRARAERPRSLPSPRANQRNYLEGDERFHVDGSATPSWHGTGTEDFYESGWYFRGGTTFTMPLAGSPAYERSGDGCRYDCTGAYRLLLPDAVPFREHLLAGIEHGPANNEPGVYSSTAYWYGDSAPSTSVTDRVEPADRLNRLVHHYRAEGESVRKLTATFEGDVDPGPHRHSTTSTTGGIEFRVRIDPENTGVRLRRLSDQFHSGQRAVVRVDGRTVGTWSQPLGNRSHRWLQDVFDVPAEFTAGKSSLRVRLTPAEDAPPWSAARYTVFSHDTD